MKLVGIFCITQHVVSAYTALNDVLRSIDWTKTESITLLPHIDKFTKASIIESGSDIDPGAVRIFLRSCVSILLACDSDAAQELLSLFPSITDLFEAAGSLIWLHEADRSEPESRRPSKRSSALLPSESVCGSSLKRLADGIMEIMTFSPASGEGLSKNVRSCLKSPCRAVVNFDLILHAYAIASAHRSFLTAAEKLDSALEFRELELRVKPHTIRYTQIFRLLYGSILLRRKVKEPEITPIELLIMWRPTTLEDFAAMSKIVECVYRTEDLTLILKQSKLSRKSTDALYDYIDCSMLHNQLTAGTSWYQQNIREAGATRSTSLDVLIPIGGGATVTSAGGGGGSPSTSAGLITRVLAPQAPQVSFDLFVSVGMRNKFWTVVAGDHSNVGVVTNILSKVELANLNHPKDYAIIISRLMSVCHWLILQDLAFLDGRGLCGEVYKKAESLTETAVAVKNRELEAVRQCAQHENYKVCPTVPSISIRSKKWPPRNDRELSNFKGAHRELEAALKLNALIAYTSNFPERYYHQEVTSMFADNTPSELQYQDGLQIGKTGIVVVPCLYH